MTTPIRHRAKRTDSAERFGMDMWVTGHYFTAPLTDENSGAPAEAGWFFLSGAGQPQRHLIEDGGCAFTVDPSTLEPVEEDLQAASGDRAPLTEDVLTFLLFGLQTADEQKGSTLLVRSILQDAPDADTFRMARLRNRKALAKVGHWVDRSLSLLSPVGDVGVYRSRQDS